MKFRTAYEARPCGFMLDPEQSVVLIGSCFTDYIGNRMRACRWRALPNITGTLFNPASIARIIRIAAEWMEVSETIDDSLTQRERLWMSWLADSGCTTYSRQDTRDVLFERLLELHNNLKRAKTMIVTFGTAWIYELRERPGYVVANCHKFPSNTFLRRRLSVAEIVEEWNSLLNILSRKYPDLRIIFTVSPVRHLKDGFEGNSRSKSILLLACEEICGANDAAEYFPSYEIVNDDLRDYRFYDSDMVHPSAEAVDYIWEKFQDRYITKESRALLAEGKKVTKRLNHRPIMHGHSELAQYMASLRKSEAEDLYNEFIYAHPGMLQIGE